MPSTVRNSAPWACVNGWRLDARPQIGLDIGITEVAASRFAYGIKPITPAVAAEQQKIADAFYALKLIPKPIRVADALPATLRTAQAAR